MTPFGWCYLVLLSAVLIGARRWLGALVLASSVFQAAAIANLPLGEGRAGIPPYALAAAACGAILAGRAWRREHSLRWCLRANPVAFRLWLAYAAVAIAGAFALPLCFEGTPVHPLHNRWGFDIPARPLTFGVSNVAQAINLALHLAVLLYVLFEANEVQGRRRLLIGVLGSAALAVVIMAWERFAFPGALPSLQRFWLSNEGYNAVFVDIHLGGIRREFAPFSEPSYAGAYLAGPLTGLLAVAALGRRVWAALAGAAALGLALLGTLSGTGLAAAGLATIVLLCILTAAAARRRGPADLRTRARIAWGGVAVLAFAAVILLRTMPESRLVVAADSALFSKIDSQSAVLRTRSNRYAVELLVETRGLGVGLGSNRASSYTASLASNTGLPGVLLFGAALVLLFGRYSRGSLSDGQLFAVGALLGTTLAMVLAIPDLNIPYYWAAIALALVFSPGAAQAGSEKGPAMPGPPDTANCSISAA